MSEAAAVASHLRGLRDTAARPDVGEAALTDVAPSISRRRAPAWARALVVFAGEGHDCDLAAQLRARGVEVTAIDTKAGGSRHDVLRAGLGGTLETRVRSGCFDIVFLATPCASYSVAHCPRLRSRRSPLAAEGRPVPAEWARYLDKHNALGALTARLIAAADAAGVAWALENPADRGDRASLAWWPAHADHAPIWLVPAVRNAIRDAGGTTRTFAQCSFGAPVQKWTSIAHAATLCAALSGLSELPCLHGRLAHVEQAHGRRPDGSSRSAAAAAYPDAMNRFLAEALAGWARRRWLDAQQQDHPCNKACYKA